MRKREQSQRRKRSKTKNGFSERRSKDGTGQRNTDDALWSRLQLTASDEHTVAKPLFSQAFCSFILPSFLLFFPFSPFWFTSAIFSMTHMWEFNLVHREIMREKERKWKMEFGDQERLVRLIPTKDTQMEIDTETLRSIELEWMRKGMGETENRGKWEMGVGTKWSWERKNI